jgi:deoxyribodipyrimidine photo-lyase
MIPQRARLLKAGKETIGPVVYWMSRDQRMDDNWALIFAARMAREHNVPLLIVFCLVPQFPGASRRQYIFMLHGLEELSRRCDDAGIPFHLLYGDPSEKIPDFVKQQRVGMLVTDFDPLRIKREWKQAVSRRIKIPFYEVDAHNIIPCWLASPKQEFSARTLRVKYSRVIQDYLDEYPQRQRYSSAGGSAVRNRIDWQQAADRIRTVPDVPEIRHLQSGERAANIHLHRFLEEKLLNYDRDRNDPTLDGQSGLSVYLHFGQISAQRVALEVHKAEASPAAKEAFLEELLIRRELSDNFCYYNPHYDSVGAFPAWAQKTLNAHRRDVRVWQYTIDQFEAAETHEALWNAAQMQMVRTGTMHGYLRMYWGKKILEWAENPETALRIAIMLNDKYQLDGRDPNGYAGCAWAIGGLHDRPWQERPVFGTIRYMNEKGCRRKFDVDAYTKRIESLSDAG